MRSFSKRRTRNRCGALPSAPTPVRPACLAAFLILSFVSAPAAQPGAPSNPMAVANYFNDTVELSWLDNASDETGFEIWRKDDDGPYARIDSVPADTTSYVDVGLDTATEFYYQVRAVRDTLASAFSVEDHTNLKTIWPVPASHEILHNWNETIGRAGGRWRGRNWFSTGFHMGVDIQRQGDDNVVRAVRSGIVHLVTSRAEDNVAIIQVRNSPNAPGVDDEYYQTNHLKPVPLAIMRNQTVAAGDTLSEIDEIHFNNPDWVQHTHYYIHQENRLPARGNPLEVFADDNDKDPGLNLPRLTEHSNPPDGTMVFKDASSGVVIPQDSTPTISGDIDIVAELGDELGTNPDQVPMKVGYWIEALDTSLTDCVHYHHVKSYSTHYVLFDWADVYFGSYPNPLALSRSIVDNDFNLGPQFIQDNRRYRWENYKHFIVTNTKSTTGSAFDVDSTQYWNTNARDDSSIADTHPDANFAGRPTTNRVREARFADGDYWIHIIASDLVAFNVTKRDLSRVVRLENFCPIVCECEPEGVKPHGTTSDSGFVAFSEAMDTGVAPDSIVSIDNGASLSNVQWEGDRTITYLISGLQNGMTYTITVDGENARDRPGSPEGKAPRLPLRTPSHASASTDSYSPRVNNFNHGALVSLSLNRRVLAGRIDALSGVPYGSTTSAPTRDSLSRPAETTPPPQGRPSPASPLRAHRFRPSASCAGHARAVP
jgi:hypothetical protein